MQTTLKMTLNTTTEIGRKGEELAINYLRKRGMRIIATNWHYHHLEIDIIAEDKDTLVFVEVKTRTNSFFGNPEEAVSRVKMDRIINAAEAYILNKNVDQEARFDIVAILIPPQKTPEIEYFKDAFMA